MRIDQPYKYIGTAICPTCDVKCSPEINPKHFKENTIRQDSFEQHRYCLLYTSPSPRDRTRSRMPSSA